jgi:hypothetical protein
MAFRTSEFDELVRKHSRAPIEAVMMERGRQTGDEYRATIEERNRSKAGWMARLKPMAQKPLSITSSV